MANSTDRGGLEGVVVADTRLSDVDGERGKLIIAGRDVEQLAADTSFEGLVAVLRRAASGRPPEHDPAEQSAVAVGLGRARVRAFEHMARLGDALDRPDGMDAIRAATAHLSVSGTSTADEDDVIAAVAVFASAWARKRAGGVPLAPDPALSHAADYLRMASGAAPDAARVRGLDAYLVTVSDHGMNASTFTARVITSTGSDLASAVVGAIGALKGPLHGGAPGPVLDMLDAVGTADRARTWIEERLAKGERIMGMGHRIYRARDPRAAVLEAAIRALGSSPRLELARAVERTAEELLVAKHPDRPLKANVEFYTAVLLEAVGLPREAFTPTFAVGRVAGWLAHAYEQRTTGRLVRPQSKYVGGRP